jgi:hypothetical protein
MSVPVQHRLECDAALDSLYPEPCIHSNTVPVNGILR